MVNALNVGNSILIRSFSENIDVTPMKLQKLIYFIYRDYLKETGIPLFNERFETWKYGPVLPSVYDEFKANGSNSIKQYALEADKKARCIAEEDAPVFHKIIDNVWHHCKLFDGIYLSSLTHKKGSAWYKAYIKGCPYLSDEDIKEEEIKYV